MLTKIKFLNLLTFDQKSYFKEYDFWKETSYESENMEYEDISNKLDTTNSKGKKYTIVLIKIKDHDAKIDVKESIEDKLKSKYFLVAEEIYSEEEITKLKPYCRCLACKASIFNPEKYFTCRCCVGCLYESNNKIRHYVVKETRKYYKLKQLPFLTRCFLSSSSLDIE